MSVDDNVSWEDQLTYVQAGSWIAAGATSLFFYDWLLLIDREVEYIWKARWSLGKVLFICHRYPMMALIVATLYIRGSVAASVDSPSEETCQFWDDFSTYATIVIFAIIQATLVVRVFALYRRSRQVLYSLSLLFCVCNATMLALYSHVRTFIIYQPNPLAPYINFCNRTCSECGRWSVYLYIPMLILDSTILILTLCQAYVSGPQRNAAPTLSILFRDGIIYFLVIFGVALTNILFLSLSPAAMSPWFLPFMRPLISSTATRLLLNLHGQIHLVTLPSMTPGGTYQLDAISTARFYHTEGSIDDEVVTIQEEIELAERAKPVDVEETQIKSPIKIKPLPFRPSIYQPPSTGSSSSSSTWSRSGLLSKSTALR